MDEFWELCERAFGSAVTRLLRGSLPPSSEAVEEHLTDRMLSIRAAGGSIGTSVAAARERSGTGPGPRRPSVTLAEIAYEALAREDPRTAQLRTREIVELMLSSASAPDRLLLAHSAVIHARAGDGMLARSRLGALRAAMAVPSPLVSDQIATVLGAYAARLIDSPDAAELTEAAQAGPGAEPALWRRVLLLGEWSAVTDLITNEGVVATHYVLTVVTETLRWIPAVTGRELDAGTRTATLELLEELVWVAAPEQRFVAWSRLALAAARLMDAPRAERALELALEDVVDTGDVRAPSADHAERAEAVADLVHARALIDAAGAASVTPTPASVPTSPVREPGGGTSRVPHELAEACMAGGVVLVAGPELPIARGAPGRTAVLAQLVDEAESVIGGAARERARSALADGNIDPAVRVIRGAWPNPVEVTERIRGIYAASAALDPYELLVQLDFAGVVSIGWDPALLDAFGWRSPIVIGSGDEAVLSAARSHEFWLAWLAGDPAQDAPIALSGGEVRSRLYANEMLSRFLTGLVQSTTLVFVGMRAGDVDDFFEALGPRMFDGPSATAVRARHWAFCERDELWDLNRDRMLSTYGIELIGYDGSSGEDLAELIAALSFAARPVGGNAVARAGASIPFALGRVLLTNIGAFESLELSLSRRWNLLLGNNGCGKSTVLRAIALGLCGDHPRAMEAGESLLRSGADSGSIELQVGASHYRTDLVRTGGAVHVRTQSLTPLQQGSWAVLGFPALRGTSVKVLAGTSATQAPEPRVEDLLPLLFDEVDNRLDDIKQWIVNVEARWRQSGDERHRTLLERFFAVLADLTPGVTIEFVEVDTAAWDVRVRTDDGVVSIDVLSQGMNSIIAWAGTLLQRMYDIHPDDPDPAGRGALVLIDELDAHMHPSWQRVIPDLARKHFANVQFIATSHSPLVASALEPGELFVAARDWTLRDDGEEVSTAVIEAADVDPAGLRADQVLTSPLFGLMTSRSPRFGADVERYGDLLVAPHRTEAEEDEFRRLRRSIAASYRMGETAQERAREAAEEARIDAQLDQVDSVSATKLAQLRDLAFDADPPHGGST